MEKEGVVTLGGRVVTYLEVGDPNGPLVLHNHGGPSSRLEAGLFGHAAETNGLRFICADRPGIGGSELQPGRTFETWANDLQLLADSFHAHRFAVTGWSEGGPWGLAAAAYLDPARLAHVSSIAGGSYGTFGANWASPYLSGVDKSGGYLALHLRPIFRLMYKLLGVSASRFEDRYVKALKKTLSVADREVLADEKVCRTFQRAGRECFRHGADGLIADAIMLYEAWPFDVERVRRPVHFWQGDTDTLVPEVVNRKVAEKTPGAVWHLVSGGHFIAVSYADDILAQAAKDLMPR